MQRKCKVNGQAVIQGSLGDGGNKDSDTTLILRENCMSLVFAQ